VEIGAHGDITSSNTHHYGIVLLATPEEA